MSKETTWYDQEKFSVTVMQDPYNPNLQHVTVNVIPMRGNGRYKIVRVSVEPDHVSVLLAKEGKADE